MSSILDKFTKFIQPYISEKYKSLSSDEVLFWSSIPLDKVEEENLIIMIPELLFQSRTWQLICAPLSVKKKLHPILNVYPLSQLFNSQEDDFSLSFQKLLSLEQLTLGRIHEVVIIIEEKSKKFDYDDWALFCELSYAKELIKWIKANINEDFRKLIDAVEEHSDTVIGEQIVSDPIDV